MTDKKNTGMAVVAYFIFFLPLLAEAKKDPFVKYHVRQGLGLLIAFFALRFITLFLITPFSYMFWSAFMFVLWLINLFLVVLLVIGIMNAINGVEKPLPVIGNWADKLLKI